MRTPLSHEQCYESTRCFENLVMGLEEALGCWKIMKLVFLRKPDAEQKKDQKLQNHRVDVGDVEVVFGFDHSSIGKGEKEPEG